MHLEIITENIVGFNCNNGYANAQQRYVIHILPVLFIVKPGGTYTNHYNLKCLT
jgi:hypothetical protein